MLAYFRMLRTFATIRSSHYSTRLRKWSFIRNTHISLLAEHQSTRRALRSEQQQSKVVGTSVHEEHDHVLANTHHHFSSIGLHDAQYPYEIDDQQLLDLPRSDRCDSIHCMLQMLSRDISWMQACCRRTTSSPPPALCDRRNRDIVQLVVSNGVA